MPNINSLQTELQAVPGFNGGNNQVAATTTAVSCVPAVQISPTYNLTRKPASSALALGAGSFTAGSLTPDAPGLYQVVVTNAGAAGPTFNVLALSAALLTRFGLAPLTVFMSNGGFSAASCAASVEQASPGPFGGVDMRLLGGVAIAGIPSALFLP